jgi:Trp operon repressor
MYNTNERDKMSLKIDIIKKVLMLDTQHELQNVLDVVGEAISRELDQDDKEQVEFKKWKAEVLKRKKEEDDKIRF